MQLRQLGFDGAALENDGSWSRKFGDCVEDDLGTLTAGQHANDFFTILGYLFDIFGGVYVFVCELLNIFLVHIVGEDGVAAFGQIERHGSSLNSDTTMTPVPMNPMLPDENDRLRIDANMN